MGVAIITEVKKEVGQCSINSVHSEEAGMNRYICN